MSSLLPRGKRTPLNRTCLVVFSGGQDSTTTLHWALRSFTSVEAVFFDYGQRHKVEGDAAQAIAWKLSIPLRRFRIPFFQELGASSLIDTTQDVPDGEPNLSDTALPTTFVPGRNLIFLTCAGAYAYTKGIRDVATGICMTDYSGYPDCREDTLKALNRALELGMGFADAKRRLRLHAPLLHRSKSEIVKAGIAWGASGSLAYSHTCYRGVFPPCGTCAACHLRAKGFMIAGVEDPLITRVKSGESGDLGNVPKKDEL